MHYFCKWWERGITVTFKMSLLCMRLYWCLRGAQNTATQLCCAYYHCQVTGGATQDGACKPCPVHTAAALLLQGPCGVPWAGGEYNCICQNELWWDELCPCETQDKAEPHVMFPEG